MNPLLPLMVWTLGAILVIFVVYMAIRLWSSAFFRSYKEFLVWVKKYKEEKIGE